MKYNDLSKGELRNRIKTLENKNESSERALRGVVAGRLRTDRATAPTSNSDVNTTDKLGDIIRTTTYQYTLVNDGGTLKWARHALDVTW